MSFPVLLNIIPGALIALNRLCHLYSKQPFLDNPPFWVAASTPKDENTCNAVVIEI
jgi:hypothetical protein